MEEHTKNIRTQHICGCTSVADILCLSFYLFHSQYWVIGKTGNYSYCFQFVVNHWNFYLKFFIDLYSEFVLRQTRAHSCMKCGTLCPPAPMSYYICHLYSLCLFANDTNLEVPLAHTPSISSQTLIQTFRALVLWWGLFQAQGLFLFALVTDGCLSYGFNCLSCKSSLTLITGTTA